MNCITTTIAVSRPKPIIVFALNLLLLATVLFVFDIKISFAEVSLSVSTSQGYIFYISSAIEKNSRSVTAESIAVGSVHSIAYFF